MFWVGIVVKSCVFEGSVRVRGWSWSCRGKPCFLKVRGWSRLRESKRTLNTLAEPVCSKSDPGRQRPNHFDLTEFS